jgi:hypothetical protein
MNCITRPSVRFRLAVAALCAIALSGLSRGELRPAPRDARAQEGYRFSIDQVVLSERQDKLTAFVSVFDPSGRSITDPRDFSALVDGTHVPIESVSAVVNQQAGVAMLLLIDRSGSMAGEPLVQTRTAADALVRGLLPQDVAALMPFAGSVAESVVFTSDHNALLQEINGLSIEEGTGTALYDAIVNGVAAAAQAPTTRRAIVLLTDGIDSGASLRTREDALAAATNGGTPIFAIGLGGSADVQLLQAIAEAAHATFFLAPGPGDLQSIFALLGAQLRSQYELVMPVPRATLASRHVAIEVDVGPAVLRAEGEFVTNVPMAKTRSGPPAWIWVTAAIFALPIAVLAIRRLPRRRRRQRSPLPGGPGSDLGLPARSAGAPEAEATRAGKLTVMDGPSAGAVLLVSSAPKHIGSDPSCDLTLEPGEGGIAARHARVWLQHERLVVHHLAPGHHTYVGETSVDWASLEPNEALRIGPYVLVFSLE